MTAMCRALGEAALDVPFAAVYLSSADRAGFVRVAAVGCDPGGLPDVVDGPDGPRRDRRAAPRAPAARSATG